MTRESGWYWVRDVWGWRVEEWSADDREWSVADVSEDDSYWEEIDERRLVREPKP